MRKRSSYRKRPSSAPMLVCRQLIETDTETKERMLVEAFSGGWATTEHYDCLADMRNVLVLSAGAKDDKQSLGMCDAISVVLRNMRDRYSKTKRMGVNGEELAMLRLFIDVYRDYWIRQSAGAYDIACQELNRAHELGLIKVEA